MASPKPKPSRKTPEVIRPSDSFYDFLATVNSLDEVIYPLVLHYRGVEIRILEVSKSEGKYNKQYFVTIQLRYGNNLTKPFTIPCRDIDEFVNLLRIEVRRFRLFTIFFKDLLSKL